jgi:hypothetical protein
MSGLPQRAGGWEAATPRWDPDPTTLPSGLPVEQNVTGWRPLLLPTRPHRATHAKARFLQTQARSLTISPAAANGH